MAHEMFHCFQFKYLADASSAPYASKKWWMEGAAEYFSNVVYPDFNIEFSHIPDLDRIIHGGTLFDMSYENFLFFQEMGNKFDNPAIISMLESFPSNGSTADYIQALNRALYESSEDFFHAFGEDYLPNGVIDTSGVPVPVNPIVDVNYSMSTEGDRANATIVPFQMTWFELSYPEHLDLIQNTTLSVAGIMNAISGTKLTLRPEENSWGDIAGEIDTSCGPQQSLMLVTNDTANPSLQAEVQVTHSEPKETCPSCLEGTWEVVQDSLGPYEKHFLPEHVQFNHASADQYSYTFDSENGTFTNTVVNLVVDETEVGVASMNSSGGMSPDSEIVITINGTITTPFTNEPWATPKEGTINFSAAQGSLTVETSINGRNQGTTTVSVADLGQFALQHATYTCQGNRLILTPDITTVPLTFQHPSGETPTFTP